jgi:hypothetical protein
MKLAPVFAAAAVSIGMAPPAHADPDVSGYLAELDLRHVEYSSADSAITMGRATCLALNQGHSAVEVVDSIHKAGYSSYDTGIILGAAMHTWCPEQIPSVKSQLQAGQD